VMGLLSRLFRGSSGKEPRLTREAALHARPVIHQLVRIEETSDSKVVLNVPWRNTGLARTVSRVFKVPPYKHIELDELGTYVIQHCDGTTPVAEMITGFAKRFNLHRREAEVSMLTFLRTLAKRRIIAFAVQGNKAQQET